MIDNEVKKIDNSFCFFTIGDITTKENRLVDLLLSLFNYNYYSIDNMVDNYNALEPLSIINKVIGYGIKNIVIDIKTGFRINDEEAKKLANEFLELSRKYEVNTTCFITSLNLSLGTSFGRNLETIEIANLLEGREYSPLLKLVIKITSFMIDKNLSLEENQALIIEYIKSQHETLAFSKKLVIELDGSQHFDNIDYDNKRTEDLKRLGYKVLRFWDNDIINNIDGVLLKILEEYNKL